MYNNLTIRCSSRKANRAGMKYKFNNMKKIFYSVLCLFIGTCLSACSSDLGDNSTNSVEKEETYKPYVSAQMQGILSMIDTCTTAIPIEKLIPINTKSAKVKIASRSSLSTTGNSDGSLVATGYSRSSTLYTKVKTVVDETQASNFNIKAGTYYVTCMSATLYLQCVGTPIAGMVDTDVMGIDPDSLSQRGYHITEKKVNSLYFFTTYIWGLATSPSNEYIEWIPIIPTTTGSRTFFYPQDFVANLQWRYYL